MVKDTFTAREVGALIERLENKFQSVSEGLAILMPLRNDMAEVKDRLSAVENRLFAVETVIRLEIPSIKKRGSTLESKSN